MWQIWLIASGIFFICEIITVGFLVFWLGIGALIAMLVSFFTSNIIVQMSVFVISSSLLIFATRPLVNKISRKDVIPTNVYSLIGKKAMVTESIDCTTGKGQIKELKRIYKDANIIPIDYDPSASETNQLNRIKLMLSTAFKNI